MRSEEASWHFRGVSVRCSGRGKRREEGKGEGEGGQKRRDNTPQGGSGEVDGNMVGYYHLSLLTLYKNRKLKISLAIFLLCVVFVLEAQ